MSRVDCLRSPVISITFGPQSGVLIKRRVCTPGVSADPSLFQSTNTDGAQIRSGSSKYNPARAKMRPNAFRLAQM